jgi:hypothetical protein
MNEEIQDIKYTTDQMDQVDVYRTFRPTSTQYTFFSAAHGTFSKIDHILGHKEIIPCILSDHNAVTLEVNNKSKDKKHANSWKLNNSLLNEQWIIGEIKEEIKSSWKSMKMKTQPTKMYGTQQRQSQEERL